MELVRSTPVQSDHRDGMVSLVVRVPSTEYLRASLPHAIKAGTWVLAALACLPVSRPISRAGALKCSSKLANKKNPSSE